MAQPLSERWWITNVQDYLNTLDLDLVRNGDTYSHDIANSWAGDKLDLGTRCIINRLGIHSFGECGGPEDQPPLIIDGVNLSNIGNVSQLEPITIRMGQCWLINNQIIEILGFRLGMIEYFVWTPDSTIETGKTVMITEANFSSGSGGGKLMDQNTFITNEKLALVLLSTEQHQLDGTTKSTILSIRYRRAKLKKSSIPPTNRFEEIASKLPAVVRDIYTDGSFKLLGTAAVRIIGSTTVKANGAIVLEIDNGTNPGYFGVKVIGTAQRISSAYTMELLALLGATYIARGLNITGIIRSDCKAAINACKSAWRKKPAVRKYPMLGYIAALIPPWTLQHVKSHPERHKKNIEWSNADCGIFVADCTAGDGASTTQAGILDIDLLEELARHLPFIILDKEGNHTLEDITARRQRLLVNDYLKQRDFHRESDTENPREPKWEGMNTSLMSTMLGLKKLDTNNIARSVKAAFDWFYTGSNRRKGNQLADASCTLCGLYEDQKHIILQCKHLEQKHLRYNILNDFRDSITLEASTTVQVICRKLLDIIETNPNGYQLLLGLLDCQLRQQIKTQLSCPISGQEWNSVLKILKEAGRGTLNLILSHLKLSALKLSGKTPNHKLIRTTYGHQKIMDHYLGNKNDDLSPLEPDSPDTMIGNQVIDIALVLNEHRANLTPEDEDEKKINRPSKRPRYVIYDDEDAKHTLIRGPGTWKPNIINMLKQTRSFTRNIIKRKRKRDN